MQFIMNFFSTDNYVYQVEAITVFGILILLGYFFYIFNVFKKG